VALELTGSTVDRTVFVLERDDYSMLVVVERTVEIALARCPVCKSRCRVLPADILARKLYGLTVIELSVSLYNQGHLSLRSVVWSKLYGERTPAHTTLHGWTEGLGAWCLGRTVGEIPEALPAARIEAELEGRFAALKNPPQEPFSVNPRRYRSQARRERLEACRRFLLWCAVLGAKTPWMLSALNRLILGLGNSFGLGFRTGIDCTAIELVDSALVASWPQTLRKRRVPCPIHGRSPPGDTK